MTGPMLSEMLGGVPEQSATGLFSSLAEQEGRVVRRGAEFDRIAALPRRSCSEFIKDRFLVEAWNEALARDSLSMHLRPIQALALVDARDEKGLFAPIGVGQGKTLIGLLLPTVLEVDRYVYLTNPGLVAQLKRDMETLSEHWLIRKSAITIVSYSQLSSAKSADLLERLQPQAIFADEVHALRHASAARTKRFLRYMQSHPETIFCAASGTITARSIKDYAHLCSLALRERSPVPRSQSVVQEWALALDAQLGPNEQRNAPGALLDFCAPGEAPREGFRRRLVETPGVVATTDSALGTGLEIRALCPEMEMCKALVHGCEEGTSWDGVELEPMRKAAVQRQLALGFHYRWDWPGEPDTEWLQARNAWSSAVRMFLELHPDTKLDSPLLVARATERGETNPTLARALERWRAVQDRPEPPVVPVWYTNEIVKVVRTWLTEQGPALGESIVWYEHTAVGAELNAALAHCLTLVRPGEDPVINARPGRALLLSIKAHGTGRNLQAWSRNLVLTPPASGAAWEQLVARTHRPGQQADTVTFDVLQHTPEYRSALKRAREDAKYIEATTGQQQKLNLATWVEV